jgi:hypothetical protein
MVVANDLFYYSIVAKVKNPTRILGSVVSILFAIVAKAGLIRDINGDLTGISPETSPETS